MKKNSSLNSTVDFWKKYKLSRSKDSNAGIRKSAACGDIEGVKFFLTNGGDINSQSSNGNTALHWAAKNGKEEMYCFLLGCKNVNYHIKNKSNKFPGQLWICPANNHALYHDIIKSITGESWILPANEHVLSDNLFESITEAQGSLQYLTDIQLTELEKKFTKLSLLSLSTCEVYKLLWYIFCQTDPYNLASLLMNKLLIDSEKDINMFVSCFFSHTFSFDQQNSLFLQIVTHPKFRMDWVDQKFNRTHSVSLDLFLRYNVEGKELSDKERTTLTNHFTTNSAATEISANLSATTTDNKEVKNKQVSYLHPTTDFWKKYNLSNSKEPLDLGIRRSAADGDIEGVKFFLTNGGNINSHSSNGNTALHWAAENGKEKMYCFLLGCKDVNYHIKNKSNKFPGQLWTSSATNHDLYKDLCSSLNDNLMTQAEQQITQLSFTSLSDQQISNIINDIPFNYNSKFDLLTLIIQKLLIDSERDINPFVEDIFDHDYSFNELNSLFAQVSIHPKFKGDWRGPALMKTHWETFEESFRFYGSIGGSNKLTPEEINTLKIHLTKNSAIPEKRNELVPYSPKNISAEEVKQEQVSSLNTEIDFWKKYELSSSKDPHAGIRKSAACGDIEGVKFFLTNGGDINSQSSNGNTALHWAAENGKEGMYCFLLGKGANYHIKNNSNKLPGELWKCSPTNGVLYHDVCNSITNRQTTELEQKITGLSFTSLSMLDLGTLIHHISEYDCYNLAILSLIMQKLLIDSERDINRLVKSIFSWVLPFNELDSLFAQLVIHPKFKVDWVDTIFKCTHFENFNFSTSTLMKNNLSHEQKNKLANYFIKNSAAKEELNEPILFSEVPLLQEDKQLNKLGGFLDFTQSEKKKLEISANLSPKTINAEEVKNELVSSLNSTIDFWKKYKLSSSKDPHLGIRRSAADGDIEGVEFFLSNRGDINSQSKNGNTALHWAAENGKEKMYCFLLGKGANYHIKNNSKKLPGELWKCSTTNGVLYKDVCNSITNRQTTQLEQKIIRLRFTSLSNIEVDKLITCISNYYIFNNDCYNLAILSLIIQKLLIDSEKDINLFVDSIFSWDLPFNELNSLFAQLVIHPKFKVDWMHPRSKLTHFETFNLFRSTFKLKNNNLSHELKNKLANYFIKNSAAKEERNEPILFSEVLLLNEDKTLNKPPSSKGFTQDEKGEIEISANLPAKTINNKEVKNELEELTTSDESTSFDASSNISEKETNDSNTGLHKSPSTCSLVTRSKPQDNLKRRSLVHQPRSTAFDESTSFDASSNISRKETNDSKTRLHKSPSTFSLVPRSKPQDNLKRRSLVHQPSSTAFFKPSDESSSQKKPNVLKKIKNSFFPRKKVHSPAPIWFGYIDDKTQKIYPIYDPNMPNRYIFIDTDSVKQEMDPVFFSTLERKLAEGMRRKGDIKRLRGQGYSTLVNIPGEKKEKSFTYTHEIRFHGDKGRILLFKVKSDDKKSELFVGNVFLCNGLHSNGDIKKAKAADYNKHITWPKKPEEDVIETPAKKIMRP